MQVRGRVRVWDDESLQFTPRATIAFHASKDMINGGRPSREDFLRLQQKMKSKLDIDEVLRETAAVYKAVSESSFRKTASPNVISLRVAELVMAQHPEERGYQSLKKRTSILSHISASVFLIICMLLIFLCAIIQRILQDT